MIIIVQHDLYIERTWLIKHVPDQTIISDLLSLKLKHAGQSIFFLPTLPLQI